MTPVEVEGVTFIREKINCIGPLVGKDGNTFNYFFTVLCDGGNVSVSFEFPDPEGEKYSSRVYKPDRERRLKEAQDWYEHLKKRLLGSRRIAA